MTGNSILPLKFRASVLLALRGVLAAGILFFLFRFVSFSEVARSFAEAKLEYLSGAIALMAVNLSLQYLKWRYFVRLINPSNTNSESAASFLFGITLGTITPGQIGEFGGRAIRHSSMASGTIVGLTLVDRLQMISVLGIGGGIGLVILFGPGGFLNWLIATVAASGFVALFFNPGFIMHALSWFGPKFRSMQWVADLESAVNVFRLKQLTVSFVFSLAFYSVICVQMFLLLNAYSAVTWWDSFAGFGAMMFTKALLPISLGDLGIREAGAVFFYSARGVAPATSLSAALLLFVINVLFPSAVGLLFMPRNKSR